MVVEAVVVVAMVLSRGALDYLDLLIVVLFVLSMYASGRGGCSCDGGGCGSVGVRGGQVVVVVALVEMW